LGAELHRTIQTGWLCTLAEAENVDLLVWISKRRIAALANATIPLVECPRGRPPQTRQSPRTEPSSIETSYSPQLRSPEHSNASMKPFFVVGKRFLPTASTLLKSVMHRPQSGKVRRRHRNPRANEPMCGRFTRQDDLGRDRPGGERELFDLLGALSETAIVTAN
jgi:hypothetical protein